MKYQDAKMVTTVRRPTKNTDPYDVFETDACVAEFTTWRADFIEAVMDGTSIRNNMAPGDTVTITIEIGEDAHV